MECICAETRQDGMNRRRKGRCPNCGCRLTQCGIDADAGKVECLNCHAQLRPREVLQDADIIFASRVLTEDRREVFLAGLGFGKTTCPRTPKLVLCGFLLLLMLGACFLSVMLVFAGHRISFLSPLVGGVLLCLVIYREYRKEGRARWVLKR